MILIYKQYIRIMTKDNKQQKQQYKCKYGCGYITFVNSNIHRHHRAIHEKQPPLKDNFDTPPIPSSLKNNLPVDDDSQEDEKYETEAVDTDIESIISNKITSMLAQNKNPIKSFMGGTSATLLAGVCIGWLLSNNIKPMVGLVQMMMGKLLPPTAGGVHQKLPSPQEIQRAIYLSQQTPPSRPYKQEDVSYSKEFTASPPSSSSIPLPTL
jgi:hypothetical protein